jgi:aspartate racemase
MKTLGLIGGISWVSTIDYYKLINEGINEKMGGINFAKCLIYSLNFAEIQAKTWTHSYELLLDAAVKLKSAGAEAIVLCANTAHLFADQIQEEIELPLVHIVSETATIVQATGLKRVGLLGTKFTMEMDFYHKKMESFGLEVLVPDSQEVRDYMQHTLIVELGKGLVLPETRHAYLSIANRLIERGAEGIILGCTEIPLILSQADFSVPVFDSTKIHVAAIVEFALS